MSPRRAIAVMLSRFPLITETFILREIIELEQQGQPVLLVPMLRESPRVVHEEAKPWVDRAMYTPYLSMAILAANLRALWNSPGRYLGLLAGLVAGSLPSPGFLARTIAIFPKSVYLAEQLQQQGIRHIHAHFATHPATMALIVSKLTDISFSITAHAHDIFVDRTFLGPKLRRAVFVRAISRFNRDFLAARYPDAASKIVVIHVGIDPENYKHLWGVPRARPPLILAVAAFKPYKGLPILIEACQQLAARGVEFRCEIIGDGPQRPQIEELIRMKNLVERVHLAGNLPQHEVADRIGHATVVVQPSVVSSDGQMEGIPVVLMEAMAASRPVVASSLSGIPELVEHGVTGLLVEPANAGALAGAIGQLLEDPRTGAEMGSRGPDKVRREFALRDTVELLLHRIDQVNPPAELTPAELAVLDSPRSLGIRRVREREDSRVVEILDHGRELILKTQKSRPGESRPPLERAPHEFELLEQLAPHGLVPRPLRIDGPSILMHRARGTPLDVLIRRWRHQPEHLVPAFRAAGDWLRRFQSLKPHGSVMYHGDFWPGNVFVTEDRVEVIDFEGCGPGSSYQDVADFLVESELFFSRHRRSFPPLRDAFLDGYRAGAALDPGELSHWRIAKLQSLRHRARHPWRRYTIRTLLQQEMNRG